MEIVVSSPVYFIVAGVVAVLFFLVAMFVGLQKKHVTDGQDFVLVLIAGVIAGLVWPVTLLGSFLFFAVSFGENW